MILSRSLPFLRLKNGEIVLQQAEMDRDRPKNEHGSALRLGHGLHLLALNGEGSGRRAGMAHATACGHGRGASAVARLLGRRAATTATVITGKTLRLLLHELDGRARRHHVRRRLNGRRRRVRREASLRFGQIKMKNFVHNV